MITLLYDGDIILHRACHSCAVSGDKVETFIRTYVDSITTGTKADRIIMVLSDSNNFRKDILPTYKANRGDGKPEGWEDAKAFVQESWVVRTVPNLEADDVLGILATSPTLKGEKIIFSVDKDFEQIPTKLVNPNKDYSEGGYTAREINLETADYNFFKQCLTGDRVDNYTGIPGVGPAKAIAILGAVGQENGVYWDKVLDAYEKAGLDEETALQQVRCARILRYEDYDFKKKEPKLWSM